MVVLALMGFGRQRGKSRHMFLMSKKHWAYAILLGVTVGFMVASVMSYLGWRLNPSGIYHSDLGTNWRFVWDTWISWFLPVSVVASVVSVPALLWLSKRSSRPGTASRHD